MGKSTRWLSKFEAVKLDLGFIKENEKGRKNARYNITEEEWESVLGLRNELDNKTENITESNNYPTAPKFVLSAWNMETGRMMNIDDYCKHYNLPRADVKSYKLVSHSGTPFFNIVFQERVSEIEQDDSESIRDFLKDNIDKVYNYKNKTFNLDKEAVLKWSDLHFGAYIRNMMHVKDFDPNILEDGLLESVSTTNNLNFRKTHIHINGDLIESFSGLNHVNSWQSMDPNMIGANVIRMCSKMLHNVLSKVDNLGKIKIVAGNHDRTSKANDEDVKGGAADLISYCLELMGYDVEFHPFVITHYVDGINHINLHGDKGISRKTTEKIILDYGIQGEYNLINEGHLHSVIEKLSVKQREAFEVLKDDSILHRRFYLPSFFTGNYYSVTLGYTTNPGYFVVWNNRKDNVNKPHFLNGSV